MNIVCIRSRVLILMLSFLNLTKVQQFRKRHSVFLAGLVLTPLCSAVTKQFEERSIYSSLWFECTTHHHRESVEAHTTHHCGPRSLRLLAHVWEDYKAKKKKIPKGTVVHCCLCFSFAFFFIQSGIPAH